MVYRFFLSPLLNLMSCTTRNKCRHDWSRPRCCACATRAGFIWQTWVVYTKYFTKQTGVRCQKSCDRAESRRFQAVVSFSFKEKQQKSHAYNIAFRKYKITFLKQKMKDVTTEKLYTIKLLCESSYMLATWIKHIPVITWISVDNYLTLYIAINWQYTCLPTRLIKLREFVNVTLLAFLNLKSLMQSNLQSTYYIML